MGIAEKLQTIAENVPKVYQAGYDKGKGEGGSSENPLEYAVSLQSSYQGVTFPDGYELTLDIPYVTSIHSLLFNTKGITKVTLKGNDNGTEINFQQAFREVSTLTEVDLTEINVKPTSISYICLNCKKLQKISGVFDMSACTSATIPFGGCAELQEIYFKPETISVSLNISASPKLTPECVQSIIDGLATVETAQTLTLNSKIVLTDEQKNTISSKGWTLVQ